MSMLDAKSCSSRENSALLIEWSMRNAATPTSSALWRRVYLLPLAGYDWA
jgi:hypothetical protein